MILNCFFLFRGATIVLFIKVKQFDDITLKGLLPALKFYGFKNLKSASGRNKPQCPRQLIGLSKHLLYNPELIRMNYYQFIFSVDQRILFGGERRMLVFIQFADGEKGELSQSINV